MRLLLDTHVFLWTLTADRRITPVQEVIEADENDIFISAASFWELAIKIAIGKLEADIHQLRMAALESGFHLLPVLAEHTEALLGLAPIHKDPFDRLLLAQAIAEPMRFMTADNKIEQYASDLVWKI